VVVVLLALLAQYCERQQAQHCLEKNQQLM
jgi:hypothetical protein